MSSGIHRALPGEALGRALSSRGVVLSPADAARVTALLLDLAAAGALRPLDTAPTTTARIGAVHSRRPSGQPTAVAKSEAGPTVYNMGPSDYTAESK